MAEDKKNNYKKGKALREAIAAWFSSQDTTYWNEKYGLPADAVLTYGEYGPNKKYSFRLLLGPGNKVESIEISGATIPITDLPNYQEYISEEWTYEPGFITGLFGLPETVPKIEEAKLIEESIVQTDTEAESVVPSEDTTYVETEVRDRKPIPGATQEIVARAPIGELKDDAFERYVTGIVDNNLNAQDAYRNATGQELPGFLTDENGDILFEERDGSFVPIPVDVQPQSLFMTGFVNHIGKQGPDVINYFKDILVRQGIANEGDFDDSGEMDINLQGYIEVLMAQSDYDNAGLMFGSNEYMDLIDTIPDSYNWVEDSNMNVEKVSWALLNRAINRYSEREKLLMNVDVKAKEKEYEIEKDIPTEAYMSRRIDALFQEELDRPPTEEERNKYLNSWNSRYDNYAQNLAYAYKAAKYGADMENYLIENGKSIDMTGAMGGDYRDTIGTREIGTRTLDDDDIREETLYEIETDLRTEKDLIEAGQNRRKHQSNIIGVMTGKI